VSATLPNFRGTGQTVIADYTVPFYTNSSISVRRKFDKFTVGAGVKNVFNQPPPDISSGDPLELRQGDAVGAVSQYDLIGRTFFLDIEAKF